MATMIAAVAARPLLAQQTAIPAERKASRVAILPITGAIDDVTLWSLERRMKAAREAGFDALVIELDTPGEEIVRAWAADAAAEVDRSAALLIAELREGLRLPG